MDVSDIFRRYDIRGIYGKDLTEGIMKKIGTTFADYAKKDIVLAYDGRLSSPSLFKAFSEGFLSKGFDIIFAGAMPLGVGMFFAWRSGKEFVYITASHLPKEWNGVKFFHKTGLGYSEQENYKIRNMFSDTKIGNKNGKVNNGDSKKIINDYIKYVSSKIKVAKPIKVVVDSGNGIAGLVAKELLHQCGCNVTSIYNEIDGTFPNRNPEPGEDELILLRKKIKAADIGIAYDGDGDRMLVVDEKGNKLSPEQTSYLILKEAIKESGPIVVNVECTMLMDSLAKLVNKDIIRIPVGHTFLVNETQKSRACYGVEPSGHYVLPSLFPFDDALAISAYAIAVLSKQNKTLSEIIKEISHYPFERMKFDCDDRKKFSVIEKLKKEFQQKYKRIKTIDGIRIGFDDGWALIRASNTGPIIRLTVEGKTQEAFERIKKEFTEYLVRKMKDY